MRLSKKKIELAAARRQKSITEVLKQAHISSGTMRRINAGLKVRPKVAGKMAAALDVDVTELLED